MRFPSPLIAISLALWLLLPPAAMAGSRAKSEYPYSIKGLLDSKYVALPVSPLDGTTFPADYPPPFFIWQQVMRGAQELGPCQVRILEDGKPVHEVALSSETLSWHPQSTLWRSWTGKSLTVELMASSGSNGRRVRAAPPTTIEIDSHSLPDDIIMRVLSSTLDENLSTQLLWVDPSKRKSKPIWEDDGRRCMGCHSANPKDGTILFVEVIPGRRRPAFRYDPRATLTPRMERIPETRASFLRASPLDTRQVAFSIHPSPLSETNFVFGSFTDFDRSQPFEARFLNPPLTEAVYDFGSGRLDSSAAAAAEEVAEFNGSWSPDGTRIAFARTPLDGRLDIYVMSYEGGRRGKPKPLRGASGNGRDNYFPEYSPDGRWIAFTMGDASTGFYARDSSDIYLVPAKGGKPRRLEFNVDGVMDSWHSWSSDSRWLLYSSKRDGITTKAYVSRIHEDGHASAPFEIWTGLGLRQRVNLPSWTKKGEIDAIPASLLQSFDPQ